MPDITEDERIWKFKSKTIILGVIAILVFTTPLIINAAFTIYEFETMKIRLHNLELKHDEDDKKTNNRIDKKTDRNKEAIEKLNEK